MNSKDDFPWKENELLKEAYKQDNYLASETGSKTGQAVIFFSSNGIYYPNDEETFRAYIQKGMMASNAVLPTGEKVRLLCHKIVKKHRKLVCALHRRGAHRKGTHS